MSSHREAPEISKDPVADSTDLYAFVSPDHPDTVTLIANYLPLQGPAAGPNFYEFGDDVLYEIHVDNNGDARADISYQFRFQTTLQNPDTFLYNTGPILSLHHPNWNRRQSYTVTRVTHGESEVLASGLTTPPYEGKAAAIAEVEGVIDYLSGIGLVDPNRVGIVAFSATGTAVGYAIAHSKYYFGAAVLADTDDAGYFTYLSLFNLGVGHAPQFEGINGGAPFGTGLASWLREAPEFSLNKVNTAMLLEPTSGFSVLMLWEWFVGFRRLGKPVEMVFMPDAGHVVIRPQDRIISQGGTADWFDFWLNGHEDSDPAKKSQYARWRELGKLQRSN